MKAKGVIKALVGIVSCGMFASAGAQVWRADQGDGRFRNPILYADYPDPDIIRIGSDYYMASTTFANTPAITILQSRDLINWRNVGHVATRLDGREQYDLRNGSAYRKGAYASTLRYRNGVFYLANTAVGQKTRVYYTRNIRGPWHYHELDREAFDPGLFIDEDDKAYIATAYNGDGTITLLTLDDTLSRVVDARKIHFIKGAEGSHIIKRNGWYYLFNAIPPRLALTVSRSRSLFGPWETRDQIDDKTGGHQGAVVDLPDGRWFGFVMVDAGAIGRMTNMSPVFWTNDWPVWGTPDAPDRVPDQAAKPIAGHAFTEPATSDDFGSRTLGLQWQWNHNPDNSRWSLSERPGYLRLKATVAPEFWFARNTLVQKGQGPVSRGTVKLDISHITPGDRCGFGTFGQFSARLVAERDTAGQASLAMEVTEDTVEGPRTEQRVASQPLSTAMVFMRVDLNFRTDKGLLAYSTDGRRWMPLGGEFPLAFAWRTGTFQGEQFAISCFNQRQSDGYIDIDSFTLSKP